MLVRALCERCCGAIAASLLVGDRRCDDKGGDAGSVAWIARSEERAGTRSEEDERRSWAEAAAAAIECR